MKIKLIIVDSFAADYPVEPPAEEAFQPYCSEIVETTTAENFEN